MVMGLQNDFIASTGHLPVDTASGFLNNIHTLIPKFRELNGTIIWVQTLYEADRLANTSSTGEGDALVIAGLLDGEEITSQAGDDESTKDLPMPVPQAQSRSAKHKQRALDLFKRVSSRRKALPVEEVKATVEEDEELFLLKRAKKGAACVPGTEGSEFIKDIKELIETPRDAVITTTNYSAFFGTNLLLTLRARLVTEIYVCGCLSNISILATVIDGARHGIKINVVQDALGFRKQARHDLALKRMEDFFDAWLVTTAEILAKEHLTVVEPVKESTAPDAKGSKKTKDELEVIIGKLSLNEKSNGLSKTPNGHSNTLANGPTSRGASSSRTQDSAIAEHANSDEEFAAALLSSRRSNGKEQRPTDAGDTKLVQSKTRMRKKKKKKKPAEGSLTEATMPEGESNQAASPDSAEPVAATRKEIDSLKAAALDAEAKSDKIQRQDVTGQRSPDVQGSQAIIPSKEGSVDDADPSPTTAASDETKLMSTTPKTETLSELSPGASIPVAASPQSAFAKTENSLPVTSQTPTTAKTSRLKSLANLPVLGPDDRIAEGDSRIVYDFIPPEYCHPSNPLEPFTDTIFRQLHSEVRWQKMLHQQGEVPRLVCCQGEIGDDGSKPVYRHPADQTLPLLHFSPQVQWIKRAAEKLVGHPLNHVLIQLYRSGTDYISEHSDKSLDIATGSSIVNVSFGAQRTMRLRTKRDPKIKTAGGDEESQRETQRVAMPHNSMFVLGLKSNEKWLHGIMADKRIEAERSNLETAYSGARISLTFRHIATFLDAKETVIWGQGATSKDQRGAADIVNNDEAEAERMIRAFSRENQSNEFNWDEWYGDGFDVLHLHEPPIQQPILFASNNALETKQVQLALWESKINHTILESPVLATEHGANQSITFRDDDAHSTEVLGLTSILHYIDRYHSFCLDKPVTAASYSLLETLSQVSIFFSNRMASPGPPRSATGVLDTTAAMHVLSEQLKDHGGPFIAGKRFGIADCVVWPALDECMETWGDWDESKWPDLVEYYNLAWKKKACLKKLRGELPKGKKKA